MKCLVVLLILMGCHTNVSLTDETKSAPLNNTPAPVDANSDYTVCYMTFYTFENKAYEVTGNTTTYVLDGNYEKQVCYNFPTPACEICYYSIVDGLAIQLLEE